MREIEFKNPIASPFVQWPGGKRKLSSKILKIFPSNFGEYYEPFVGGGAMFFTLAPSMSKKAHLSDMNPDLINAYKVIKTDPKGLIKKLRLHKKNHSRGYYLEMRKWNFKKPVSLAARFLYLNKTCWNGLYRVNKQGQFNVPIGINISLDGICDEQNILNASKILKKATIKKISFENIEPKKNDLIYCDPPYDGVFTQFTKEGFDEGSHLLLKEACLDWHNRGAHVIISNSNTKLIRSLYSRNKGFKIRKVQSQQSISYKKQEKVTELLITPLQNLKGMRL